MYFLYDTLCFEIFFVVISISQEFYACKTESVNIVCVCSSQDGMNNAQRHALAK